MNIVWSPRAQIRLTEYARQLAEYDCPETARSWLLAVQAKSTTLADVPRAGRVSPEFRQKRPTVRDITIGNYRLFYRIRKDTVEIISIHNCKQQINSLRSL